MAEIMMKTLRCDSEWCQQYRQMWLLEPKTVLEGLIEWPHVTCGGCGVEPRVIAARMAENSQI